MLVVEEREAVVNAAGELVPQRPRVKKIFTKPSLTRQEFKEECDLGLILKRFGKTPEGQSALRNAQGFVEGLQFGDVSSVPEYRQYRDIVNAANAKFMALPAIVRRRFDNDPAEFLDFMQNPANRDEGIKLGLIKEPVKVADATSSTPPVKG